MKRVRRATLVVLCAGLGLLGPRRACAREAVEGEWVGTVRNPTKVLARVRVSLRVVDGRLAGELVVPREGNPGASESSTYEVKDASRTSEEWHIVFHKPPAGVRLSVVLREAGGGLQGPLGGWAEDQETFLVLRPGPPNVSAMTRFAGTWSGTHRVPGKAGTLVQILGFDLRVTGDTLEGVLWMEDPAIGDCPARKASLPVADTQVEGNRIRISLPSPSLGFVGLDLTRAAGDGPLEGTTSEGVFLDAGEPRLLEAGAVRLARGATAGLAPSFEPAKTAPSPDGPSAPGNADDGSREGVPSDPALEPYVGRWEGRLTLGAEPGAATPSVIVALVRTDGRLGGELRVDGAAPAPWGGKRLDLRAPRLRGDTLFLEGRIVSSSGVEETPHALALVLGRQESEPAILGCVRGWPEACRDHVIRLRRAK